jgi:hypothetical protein
VQIGQEAKVTLLHFLLVQVIETKHLTTSEETSISGSDMRQEAVLLHGIIENRCFNDFAIMLLGIGSINKLLTDSGVTNSNGSGLCKSITNTYK